MVRGSRARGAHRGVYTALRAVHAPRPPATAPPATGHRGAWAPRWHRDRASAATAPAPRPPRRARAPRRALARDDSVACRVLGEREHTL